MLEPGRERMRRLRFEGAKGIEDAMMIPDTLLALTTVAKAAAGHPWVLAGSLAASCWMRSRATVVIEILVPGENEREAILGRAGSMPLGHEVQIRTAEELDLAPEMVTAWHARARRDVVEGVAVHVPLPRDLFIAMLAEPRVMEAPYAMYYACRLHLLHGPWPLDYMDLTPYQCGRLGEAAALLINHAAGELKRIEMGLTPNLA